MLCLMGWVTLAVLTPSCRKEVARNDDVRNDDLRNELHQAIGELRQENRELREKLATLDKQFAQLTGRLDESRRAEEAASQKAAGNLIASEAEARLRSESDARVRTEQSKQQAVATVKKLAAQMDRLLEEIPSLENSLAAWDVAMPKLSTLYKNSSLQMNSLAAELDGLKFGRSDEARLKITGFCNGYQSLPGIGRIVVSSRERAAAVRAAANPSVAELDSAASDEAIMAAQLSVFNATLAECNKIRTEVSKLAD